MPSLTPHRTHLLVLAVLVAAFVALYPYLDCDAGQCPEASHLSHTSSAGPLATCLVAVLASTTATLASAPLFKGRRADRRRRPAEAYLSPDPPPPRITLSR
jgi:hypothetical protein